MSSVTYPLAISNVNVAPAYHTAYNGVINGDSLSANASQWAQTRVPANGGVPALSPAYFLFGTDTTLTTVAVANQTLVTMNANAAANVDTLQVGGMTNFVMVQGGNQDAVNGSTAATIAALFATYIAARKAAGWAKVVLFGLLQSSGNTSVYAAVNNLLRANWISYGADAFVDVARNSILGAPSQYANPLWFLPDQLTLTPNGVSRYTDLGMATGAKVALGL